MFHPCTFCYLVNKSYTGKHLEAKTKAISREQLYEGRPLKFFQLPVSGGKSGAVQTRTLAGCKKPLAVILLTREVLGL